MPALTTGLDGSIYVGGFTSGALDLQANSGSMDAFVTKYTQDGVKVWSRLIGTSSYDQANALTTGLDGSIYVSGYTYGTLDGQANSGGADAFITKYSADGTKVWTRLVGTTGYEQSNALTTGLDGSIYLSGYTYSSLDGQTNAGSMDALVTKFSPDGTKVWTRLLGTSGADQALGLTTGLEGAIYVSGYTSGALDGQANSGGVDAFLAKYQDLATIPSFALNAVSSYVNEGSNAAFVLTTSNLPAGTSLGYFLTGTGITNSDFANGQLSGTAVVDASGKATILIPIAADQTKEGQETVTIAIQGVSASTVINDTSLPPVPGYYLTPASSAVNEGTAAIFYVTTNNVPTGTSLQYILSGVGITSGDFSGGQLSGSVVIDGSGKATISIPIALDGTTEGPETLIVSTGGTTATTIINDTGIVKIGTSGMDWISPSIGSDSIDGGGGIDTVFYRGNQNIYTLKRGANSWTLFNADEGEDLLTNVERLHFADLSVALDLAFNQAAGQSVLLLGAVLPGKLALDPSKQQLLGTVIGLFDSGFTLTDLAGALLRLDIWTILAGSNSKQAIASYLLSNVNGVAPDAVTLATAVTALNSEAVQGTWLAALAGGSAGQSHIGLSGIAQSGLAYLAPESISASGTSVNEGGAVDFTVTTNLQPGNILSFTLSGTGITSADIVQGLLSGTVPVGLYGQVTVRVNLAADSLTEGPETLVFTSRGLSAAVVVNDTSQFATISASNTSVDEGSTVSFTVKSNLQAGTMLTYTLSGVGITGADIVGGLLSGTLPVGLNGQVTVPVPIAADNLTEGPETLVFTSLGLSITVVVNDTSRSIVPTLALTSMNSAVNEGQFANFTLTTTNVPPGTVYQYTISGVGITSNDIAGGQLSGLVSIGSTGTTTISIPIAADAMTEGQETLVVTIAGQTAYALINDVSVAATTYTVSASALEVKEGETALFTVFTTNLTAGTILNYAISGVNITAEDFVDGRLQGAITIDSFGRGLISVPIKADGVVESSETMIVSLIGIPNASTSVKILDIDGGRGGGGDGGGGGGG